MVLQTSLCIKQWPATVTLDGLCTGRTATCLVMTLPSPGPTPAMSVTATTQTSPPSAIPTNSPSSQVIIRTILWNNATQSYLEHPYEYQVFNSNTLYKNLIETFNSWSVQLNLSCGSEMIKYFLLVQKYIPWIKISNKWQKLTYFSQFSMNSWTDEKIFITCILLDI